MSSNDWNINKAKNVKTVAFLVYQPEDKLPLINYFGNISNLAFTVHASEWRFGDTYYYRGSSQDAKALIVPTKTLSAIPRKYRKDHWYYVKIFCHPDDIRFDRFSDYKYLSIQPDKYKV